MKPLLLLAAAMALGACGSRSTSDTVFVEDFESGDLSAWQDGAQPATHRIVTDPGFAASGNRYLEVTYQPAGDGGWLTRWLPPGYDSLFVSYDVRFEQAWSGGTKLIAVYGSRSDDRWSALGKAGRCPNGTDFFAAMLVTELAGDPGPARFYSYYPAMAREPDGVTCWGRYGDDAAYTPPLTLTRGVWHHVEFRVRLNTPGASDASQTFWIDGVERGHWEGFSFRNDPALRLNAVQLTFNRGISGGANAQKLYVDHLVVTTSPQQAHALQSLEQERSRVAPTPHFAVIAAGPKRQELQQRAHP